MSLPRNLPGQGAFRYPSIAIRHISRVGPVTPAQWLAAPARCKPRNPDGTQTRRSSPRRTGKSLVSDAQLNPGGQPADGGWSKQEFDDHLSLTLISCLSLHALAAVGTPSNEPTVDCGLRWIETAQNPDGGWGQIARDERSDVTATAYALRALAVSDSTADTFKKPFERGADWMIRQRNADGGWGIRSGEPSSLAHTAHAVEGLLACGYRREPQGPLENALNWFLQELPKSPLVPWVEHYHLPPAVAQFLTKNLRSARLRWTHLPAERAMIALLALGVASDNELFDILVADLASRHEKGKSWRVQTMPEVIPSWEILEATNALCRYVEALERDEYRTAFSSVLGKLVPRVTTLEKQHRELQLQVEELSKQVSALARPQHNWTRAAWRFIVAPATQASTLIATGVAVLLLYLGMWSHGQDAGTRLIWIATIMVPVLALLEMIRRRRVP